MSKPDKPKTPEHEKVLAENAKKNLAIGQKLHDNNFATYKKNLLDTDNTREAGTVNADSAKAAAKSMSYSGKPLALATAAHSGVLNSEVNQVGTHKGSEGMSRMANEGMSISRQNSAILKDLSHIETIRDRSKHDNSSEWLNIAGSAAGAAYYASDGFKKNPFTKPQEV